MKHLGRPRAAWILLPALAVLAAGAAWLGPQTARGDPPTTARVPGTLRIEGSPDAIEPYVIVEAFPKLRFDRPIWIGYPPDGSNVLWVCEQGGVIKVFENDRETDKVEVALDLTKEVSRTHNEEGLLGMAFDPDFKKTRAIYVTYTAGDPRRLVLSRFETSGTRRRVRASTERVLLRQRQPHGNHNGGCVAFGPDGKLYLSLGDGGSRGDPEDHAQNLDSWLGAILRLDVSDKKTARAPSDNPFVGVQHTRPEIWAYGLQNPRRFSFDRVTGELWAGDVGNVAWQEIDLITKGGNYGWSLREGSEPFKPGKALVDLREPLYVLGGQDARRITGGVVYRGKRLPGLVGAYLYGDSAVGNVWALRSDGQRVTENRLIDRGRGVSSFGEDADGEVYFTSFDGRVYTLVPWSGHKPKGRFPRLLSETGLFTDMPAMTPHPSLIPYDVNVPLWSDGAQKQRYLLLPGMEKIQVRADGTYDFPLDTIFVKSFYLGDPARGPLPGTRLETRLFVRRQRDWEGYTYVWDAAQTEAHLLDGRLDQPRHDLQDEQGHPVAWTFPSRSDCMSCHTEVANRVLGFRTEQLDRLVERGGTRQNQLDLFRTLGVFEGDVAAGGPALASLDDPQAGEERILRSWLDSNCSMCHRPGGPGNALIDLRASTPLEETHMVDQRPGQWSLDVYDGRLLVPGDASRSLLWVRLQRIDRLGMPPLSQNLVPAEIVKRMKAWIDGMKK